MALSAGTRVGAPGFKTDGARHRREMVRFMEQGQLGHIACVGSVTLTANITSTTVADTRAGAASFIWFMPLTQDAAGELANGNLYVSTRDKQFFVITHTNSANANRSFVYAILG